MRVRAAAIVALGLSVFPWFVSAQGAVERSPVPEVRPEGVVVTAASNVPADVGFRAWVDAFRKRALAQGISADVYDAAMAGVAYNAKVVRLDSRQAEFTKQIWDYLDTAVSDLRVSNGRAAVEEHADLLAEIEARYGVEKEVVAAIWGLESAYGTFRGDVPIVGAMASLAYDGRRAAFFEEQLIAALRILQDGDTGVSDMAGSWAGAMGHTQFMPGSYRAHAVDFTGDGRRDIWGDDPSDALASTAVYLQHHGWTKGQPWGMEVELPEDFDYALTSERIKKPAAFWNARGVRDLEGAEIPDHGPASILLPAGHRGAAFVIFENFHVLERYNTADAYVIGVGHLADRIAGGAPIRAGWPRGDRALSFDEKRELQRRLLVAGFDPDGVDGIIGPNTIAAVKAYQASVGLVPDGYASLDVLKRLR
ncbi:lytic murein transglycosylase [Psychromarinibacter sp. C21-152]|uniref:Lytic murein transglycosylase n=1 Tax=Psychromarinibacter sediminicola TaxID=3033385 RepID=A0AAE3TB54_9RHOB|nr:lytic murein transglycosylase [Psychromarinibacter sediminicola]MDF0602320.1 lytic murein transglycosylase [Psychromarinibacter sediminicola]